LKRELDTGFHEEPKLVEIEASGYLTHLFESEHSPFGTLRTLNLGLEFMGVNFGSIGIGQERSDLVGCAVDYGRFAGRGTMEDVDERPTEVLGIGLQRSSRDHCKEIGPDRFESLDDRFVDRKIIGGHRGRTNRKTGKIEAGKLLGK
jgi:hypothetical protein